MNLLQMDIESQDIQDSTRIFLEDVAPSVALCDMLSHEESGPQKKFAIIYFLGSKKIFLGTKKKLGKKKKWEQKKIIWGAVFFLGALKKLWGRNKYKSKDD
jgi:hypothetical protein